jgi:hypothetical protein
MGFTSAGFKAQVLGNAVMRISYPDSFLCACCFFFFIYIFSPVAFCMQF